MLNKEMVKVTNEYLQCVLNQGAGFEAHNRFWEAYETEKAKKLTALFGDNLIIEKEVDIKVTEILLRKRFEELDFCSRLRNAFDPCWQKYFDGYMPYAYGEESDSRANSLNRAQSTIQHITGEYALASGVAEPSYRIIHHLEGGKDVKINSGSKIMKLMKNFISNKVLLDELQTEYSQIVNTKTVKGILCISIHPLDYLTASVNECGWSSCFNTYSKGEWCASTLSLINSPNTVIAYLKSSKDTTLGGVEWNNKKWRTYLTVSEDNQVIHVGKQYPYYADGLADEAVQMLSGLIEGEEFKIREGSQPVYIYTPENMYNDADCGHIDVYATKECNLEDAEYRMDISTQGSICPICGSFYDDCEFDIVCGDCSDSGRCYHCDTCLGDNGYWIEAISEYVCQDCFDNYYTYCSRCDEAYDSEDCICVGVGVNPNGGQKAWYGTASHYYTEHWCSHCVNELIEQGEMAVCEVCGDTVVTDGESKENFVCLECRSKNESE